MKGWLYTDPERPGYFVAYGNERDDPRVWWTGVPVGVVVAFFAGGWSLAEIAERLNWPVEVAEDALRAAMQANES